MNIAFLVEGTTELQLYPRWIQHLATTPLSKCATGYQDVLANQFTIFNVAGIGKMRTEIPITITAIQNNPVFDFLVVVVDADDNDITPNQDFIQSIFDDPITPQLPPNCQTKIIVQQACIETWFIGHTDHFNTAKESSDNGIKTFMTDYDAQNNDPEMMPHIRPTTTRSMGVYHATFLKTMLRGVDRRWFYNKATAHVLIDMLYFERLENRLIETPTHLSTFSKMIDFLKTL
jgi:hypothetical protein